MCPRHMLASHNNHDSSITNLFREHYDLWYSIEGGNLAITI